MTTLSALRCWDCDLEAARKRGSCRRFAEPFTSMEEWKRHQRSEHDPAPIEKEEQKP